MQDPVPMPPVRERPLTEVKIVRGRELRIVILNDGWRKFWQGICTWYGYAEACPFAPCRRARACATRDVLCFQAVRHDLFALFRPAIEAKFEGKLDPSLLPDNSLIPPPPEW